MSYVMFPGDLSRIQVLIDTHTSTSEELSPINYSSKENRYDENPHSLVSSPSYSLFCEN